MNSGETFQRDGTTYEIHVSGTCFKEKNKSNCILPVGKNKCISINQALEEGLIVESNGSDDLFSGKPPREPDGTYYMPVDQLRAQVFLAHGLIYPATYDSVEISSDFADSQSPAPGELTLFNEPQAIRKDHLQLRVLLLPEEIQDAGKLQNGIRLSMPLPISRILEIQICPEVKDIGRYLAGWVKADVPIPSHLFRLTAKKATGEKDGDAVPSPVVKGDPKSSIKEGIRKFNQRLGALAFLRNAGRYLSERTGNYSDYPLSYIKLAEAVIGMPLSVPDAGSAPTLSLAIFGLNPPGGSDEDAVFRLVVSGLSYIDKEAARNCANEVYVANGKSKELAQAFKSLFTQNDYRTAIRELQCKSMSATAAILAALFKFSNRNGDDRRSVKQRLHDDWASADKMEAALCALGAYYGYTALDARETKLYSVHPQIRPLVNETPAIKFDLSSRFERRLIEAVYQLSFFGGSNRKVAMSLYDSDLVQTVNDSPVRHGTSLKDTSFSIQDLFVRRYSVTTWSRIIDKLRSWARGFVDEKSETGKYLMSSCLSYADSYELIKEGNTVSLHYRISVERLVELLTECRISVNANILESTLAADCGVLKQ